jgi:hypothetical protein
MIIYGPLTTICQNLVKIMTTMGHNDREPSNDLNEANYALNWPGLSNNTTRIKQKKQKTIKG